MPNFIDINKVYTKGFHSSEIASIHLSVLSKLLSPGSTVDKECFYYNDLRRSMAMAIDDIILWSSPLLTMFFEGGVCHKSDLTMRLADIHPGDVYESKLGARPHSVCSITIALTGIDGEHPDDLPFLDIFSSKGSSLYRNRIDYFPGSMIFFDNGLPVFNRRAISPASAKKEFTYLILDFGGTGAEHE